MKFIKKKKAQRKLIKLSNLLLKSLEELHAEKCKKFQNELESFCNSYSNVSKDSRLFRMAVHNRWSASVKNIRQQIERNLNDFSFHLDRFKDFLKANDSVSPMLPEIFKELVQLEDEFGEISFDSDENAISVTTERITLEDIPLGEFEIKLFLDKVCRPYSDSPYCVIALDPNPADSNDEVTHPHVSSERLCEGDGRVPIRMALEQGRFCDFFTMIANVLQNYNPHSPYIALEDWDGVSCYDCGCTVSDDDRYCCEYCNNDFCSQCSTYCQKCETTICLGCAYQCPSCNEPVCRDCTAMCQDCEQRFCTDCLDEDGLCKNCVEQRKEEENEESYEEKTGAAIHADGMGQAAVHA